MALIKRGVLDSSAPAASTTTSRSMRCTVSTFGKSTPPFFLKIGSMIKAGGGERYMLNLGFLLMRKVRNPWKYVVLNH